MTKTTRADLEARATKAADATSFGTGSATADGGRLKVVATKTKDGGHRFAYLIDGRVSAAHEVDKVLD